MTSGRVSRDTVLQEIRPRAGFETGDFVNRKVGGATVVSLIVLIPSNFVPKTSRGSVTQEKQY